MVLFSDGQSHDQSKAVRVAREMKEKGVEILCVGIGNGITVERLIEKLKEISSKPEYTFKSTVNALNTIEDTLVKDMCEAISKQTQRLFVFQNAVPKARFIHQISVTSNAIQNR